MSKLKNILKVIKKVVIRLAVIVPLVILFLFCGALVAVQIPSVQTSLVAKATEVVSNAINFPVSIDKVNIRWLNTLRLEGVRLMDNHGKDMITVRKIDANFRLLSFFNGKNIVLNEAILDSADVNLYLDEKSGDLNMDEFVRRLRRMGSSTTDTTPSKSFPFIIKKVILKNSHFQYFDEEEKEFRKGFDHFHFGFNQIEIEVDSFKINRDTVEMNIVHLSGIETSSGLPIHQLSAKYRLTDLNMTASNLKASIGSSFISNQLVFNYSEIYSLSDFLDSVSMDLNLQNTQISTNDLAQFAPELAKLNQIWTISGIFNGKVGDFTAKKLNLRFGRASLIKGNLDFKGLPDFYNTFVELDLNKTIIYAPDLHPFLDNKSYEFVRKLGKVAINGSFIGFPKDFVYSGSFASEIGYLETDLNLKIKGIEKTFYEGKVTAKNFNLGKFLGHEAIVRTVDMNGQINGIGLNLSTLKMKAEAQIQRIDLLGYNYKNAKLDASLAKNYFSGELIVKDTNLRMKVSGYADASIKPEKIRLQVNLEHANLRAIHLLDEDLTLSTKGDMNFTGLIQSETEGFLQFSDIHLTKGEKTAQLDNLDILSEMNSGQREIKITSDWVSADLKGDFLIKTLAKEAIVFIDETKLAFKNDSTALSPYHPYQRHPENQSISFDITLKKINPILKLFFPEFTIADGSHISGSFISGEKYHFDAKGHSKALGFKDKLASNDSINVLLEKLSLTPKANATVKITSKSLLLNPSVSLEEFYGNIDWKDDKVDFTTGTKQKNNDNSIDLAGFLTLFDTKTDLRFTDSDINILDKHWTISDSNSISITPNSIIFHSLSFFENQQRIRLNGTLNNNPLEPLHINIDNFNLATLNSLIRYQLKGTLNGRVTIKDLYQNISIDNKITCDSLYINNFLFGNLTASSSYDNFLQKIILNADLERDGSNIASMAGHYDPKDNINPINLNVKLNKANISVIEPFISDVLSDLKGEASGILDVDGSFEKPLITGEVDIDNGQMKVNYLNTTYSFSDKFYFTKDFFGFKNCQITDPNNKKGILDGGIYHTYFNKMHLGISGIINQFQVLNTQEKDNDVFYGTGIVSGSFALTGPFNNILITANVSTDDGTHMFLPLSRNESVSRQNFITFVTKKQKDSILNPHQENKKILIDSSRIRFDFEIEMTKDAYCEIIFDKKSGDIIRGFGNGLLRMNMDTKGEFTMYGNYTISQGAYNFTMLNIINKGFTIKPGSRVTWNGDPLNAQLDITAYYTQNVSLLPILPVDTAAMNKNSAFSRRYPTVINLNLKGNMLKPDINYGLEIKDYPTNIDNYPIDLYVKAFLASLQSNEQEMNKQVFSLLVLKSFLSNTDSRFTNLSQSAFGSVSELVSNQLNNWLSQVDENLQIDIDLNGLDKNALNAMRMRLSYSLLQGRLRITRDGGFTNTKNQASTYAVLGEWTVEYLLTKDGILRLKMFNKNNPNAGVTALDANSNGFAGGFSLLHTQSFDNLNDLFKRKEKEEEKSKTKSVQQINKDIINKKEEEAPNNLP